MIKHSVRNFDSLAALEALAAPVIRAGGGKYYKNSCKPAKQDWDLNLGASKSLDLLASGWQDGANKVLAASVPLTQGDDDGSQSVYLDEEGYFLVPQLADSDDPCFIAIDNAPRSVPVVRLYVGIVAAYDVSASDFVKRGAAYLTVINALESSGIRVELYAGSFSFVDGGQNTIHWTVKIKDAGEQVNLQALAYALAHPAFFRRLGFAIIEEAADTDKQGNFCGSYGRGPRSTDEQQETLDKILDSDVIGLPSYYRASDFYAETVPSMACQCIDHLVSVGKLPEPHGEQLKDQITEQARVARAA